MSTLSIIGSGGMAAAIGTRAVKHGHTVEVASRDAAKAQALVDQMGSGASVGAFGAVPSGDIVVVAVPYPGVIDVVAHYGEALAGKTVVEISNPFNAAADGLVTPSGTSAAQEVTAVAPATARVVKAFNTVFGHVLVKDGRLDAFYAGEDAEAKARVAALLESLGLRPLDAGGIEAAQVLEWAGLLLMGVARNGAGFELALGVDIG